MPNDNLFPDLDKNHPDCSVITDDELSNTIVSHWPVKDGVSTIPYSLSPAPFWASFLPLINLVKYPVFPEKVTSEMEKLMKERIRFGLEKWTSASNGTLQFIENNNINPYSSGIFFYLGGSEQYFSEVLQAGAVTYRRFGFNGEFNRAYVFLPNDGWFWSATKTDHSGWAMFALEHEQGHALGFNHLHEYPEITAKLQNISNGVYCSVMPYPELISTGINKCYRYCQPAHAVYPGLLDSKLAQLSTHGLAINHFTEEMILSYSLNGLDAVLIPMLTNYSHNIVASFVANLTPYRNKTIIPENMAYFIADGGLISALMYLNFPMWVSGLYAATSMTKLIPEKYLNKMPASAKKLLISNYNFHTLATSIAYIQNASTFALLLTAAISSLALTATNGRTTENLLGKMLATIFNQIPQAVVSCYRKASEHKKMDERPPEEKLIDVSDVPSEQSDLINHSRVPATLFYSRPSRPASSCGRLMSWLCGKTYQPVAENEDIENHLQLSCVTGQMPSSNKTDDFSFVP